MLGKQELLQDWMNRFDPAGQLPAMEPELALEIAAVFAEQPEPVSSDLANLILGDILWGLALESAFGRAVGRGYLALLGKASGEKLLNYHELIHSTHEAGPTMGRLMAAALVPILIHTNEDFLHGFLETRAVMLTKGSYTLAAALDTLAFLLQTADVAGARAFLGLLKNIFSRPLSYNRSRHLAQIVPKAVRAFPISKRVFQIHGLDWIVRTDIGLVEGFLEGFDKGLGQLDEKALAVFMAQGLARLSRHREAGEKFLTMTSIQARDLCRDLQVTATLLQVRGRLNRYLQARTGLSLTIRPLSVIADKDSAPGPDSITVLSDGKFVYLPDEIHAAPTWTGNEQIYQMLVRLEAAYYECGTHDFDMEKAAAGGWLPQGLEKTPAVNRQEGTCEPSDLERFWGRFDHFQLAADLFLIFEHGRIRQWLGRNYPGILRRTLPILLNEAQRMAPGGQAENPLLGLYQAIALGHEPGPESTNQTAQGRLNAKALEFFYEKMAAHSAVEIGALLVTELYPEFAALYPEKGYRPLVVPYRRRIRPDLFRKSFDKYHQTARRLQRMLAPKNIKVYRGDIQKKLRARQGSLTKEDLLSLVIIPPDSDRNPNPAEVRRIEHEISSLDLAGILNGNADSVFLAGISGDSGKVFRYKEWDCRLQEYIEEHVLVRERPANPAVSDFFDDVRRRHAGLLKKIRHSFEILKPQGLTLLRRWIEGDGFDYRALIDYCIDRKSGIMPSDRLYIKRLKQVRDVCVLLLVDLSRSTANAVAGGRATVLDIEKEAIVLLCEALSVVGDRFSIAGFSGSGRLGVDYFMIKDFDEPVDENVRLRINGMLPQRSTRMGAAIRHALARLSKMEARVRLLLVLGDGFPNDSGYKQEYAIEDTRRALFEARGRHIHTHGITVNMAADARLDDIYGKSRHHMISDVRELPDKLFRIYGALTRQSV